MLTKSKIRFFIFAVFLTALIFTTCDSPLGMGDPIDWEPPVLTLDPKPPTPMYVREGAQLTGTVTDNVAVDRVILRDQATGNLLFTAQLLPNDRWQIDLVFTEEQNGETILADVVAYDTAGNSDARSIATVVLYIDIRPPIIRNISISRTETRLASLEPYSSLLELETLDPRGEKKDNLYRYQNGWFHVSGIVEEDETKIEVIALNIYDTDEPNTPLLSLPIDSGYSPYSPRWTVKEDDIISAGVVKYGANYSTKYYTDNERYYYRVTILAIDKSGNESIEEDEGYICMWVKSDEPKGILDPTIGTIVSRGTPLPVDFFDDDSLLWAYTGLLTEDQWNGIGDIAPGVKIPTGKTDEQILLWLKERLTGAIGDSITLGGEGIVYNWKYDKNRVGAVPGAAEPIRDEIKGGNLDEKLIYVPTGNNEEEYGDYVLFTIVADKKLPPHSGNGPERTNRSFWSGNLWHISVIDENIPLIVFDTRNGCPEENTFPNLTNGESFTIKGYTLRENGSGNNKVTTFRMAWIPFEMEGGADTYIPAVQRALSATNYPYSINGNTELSGVQHWEFVETDNPSDPPPAGYGKFGPGIPDLDVPGSIFNRQDFQKTFSVLGAQDGIKTADPNYKNFIYKSKLENETKLFVFYAMDTMGHEVYRQLRLLSMKTPPDLAVYDISNKVDNDNLPALPDPNDSANVDLATGGVTDAYYALLKTRNEAAYSTLLSASGGLTTEDRTIPFQIYPRGTILKYWVNAENSGDIAVKSISMKDISYSTAGKPVGSSYDPNIRALSFCELYPDVTQRTFLFEAEDMLGNVARIQRTIAVTNAARLENITTTEQSGTYGIGKKITIKANFSSQIYVEGVNPIILNARYHWKGGNWAYTTQLFCLNPPTYANPALSLDFEFFVPPGTDGRLETMYEDIDLSLDPTHEKRPIILNSSSIMDYLRGDSAFIPGYRNESVIMPNWSTAKNSLQEKKNIILDGTPPVITGASVGGKDPYATGEYYFKTGETINFTLSADKPIRASDPTVPRLQYSIRDSGNVVRGPYTSEFLYSRPGGTQSLVFSLPVSGTSCPYDGELVNVSLYNGTGEILDNVDNAVNAYPILAPGARVFIKKAVPAQPAATLGGAAFGTTPNNSIYFASSPNLVVTASTSVTPAPSISWEDKTQYSTNGGMGWEDIAQAPSMTVGIPGGTHRLQVRYVDRAGNEGVIRDQAIQVTSVFPKLIAASAAQSNGWYTEGSNLAFNLSFDDTVTVNGTVNITLEDISTGTTRTVNADAGQNNVTTVKFSWNGITGVEMPNGIFISAVNLSGLRDRLNITNPSGIGTGTCSTTAGSNIISVGGSTCPNLPYGGIKVDAVAPTVSTRSPSENNVSASDVLQITLTFSESVMKGKGIITIRPRGSYAIPPVFRDTGYYINTAGNEVTTGTNLIYIPSFYDIYNNSALTAQDRNNLTKGTSITNPSMSSLDLHARTGQSYGPYKKTTHGLINGPGYTGSYNNTTTPGASGPNPDGTLMIPDTTTKWVLDYKYGITQNIAEVNNIRTALSKAKFRWQEIDVVNTSISGKIVTINLNEPLLKGLQWDVYYPAGTFTDLAGNSAPASGDFDTDGTTTGTNNDYYFTSAGVQPPVIRVNRRSYDARNSNWASNTNRTYQAPIDTTPGWATAGFGYTDNPANGAGDNGWGINDFNTVHYRIESESPNATVSAKTYKGADTNQGAVTAAWTGNVQVGGGLNAGASLANPPNTNLAWNVAASYTAGSWVLTNLIHRSSNTADANNYTPGIGPSYTITTKNNTPETRTLQGGDFRMFRSYNRDLTETQVEGAPTTAALTNGHGILTFTALEANKSYIYATATGNGANAYGYEGVFRTVIVLNHATNRGNNFILLEGSNIKNGMPSVAGFPVRDAEETGDNRFIKVFYSINLQQFYWVSTEIVCEWYFLQWGGGGTHQMYGEVNNYMMVGYGDLTYGYNVRTY
jgi:hypothetical protein